MFSNETPTIKLEQAVREAAIESGNPVLMEAANRLQDFGELEHIIDNSKEMFRKHAVQDKYENDLKKSLRRVPHKQRERILANAEIIYPAHVEQELLNPDD